MLIINIILNLFIIKNASCENVSILNGIDNKPFSIEANLYKMKTKTCGIYKITSPLNKIYIGQSANIENRIRVYKNVYCKRQPKIYGSLKKYGWDNHKFEIIKVCLENELDAYEIYYIDFYQSNSINSGLNLNKGGKTYPRHKSKEIGKKIGDKLRGIKRTDAFRKRVSELQKGNTHNNKKISQFDKNMNLIKVWDSCTSASLYFGNKSLRGVLSAVSNGTKCSGYFWNYTEEPISKEKQSENKSKYNIYKKRFPQYKKTKEGLRLIKDKLILKKISQFDENYNFIKEWDYCAYAARFYSCSRAGILYSINVGSLLKGFYWNFSENPISEEKRKENRLKINLKAKQKRQNHKP